MDGRSWADQWGTDQYSEPSPTAKKKKSGGLGGSSWAKKLGEGFGKTKEAAATKYGKVGEGMERTKSAASGGVKKVKEGTSVGLRWIKEKCHKTSH